MISYGNHVLDESAAGGPETVPAPPQPKIIALHDVKVSTIESKLKKLSRSLKLASIGDIQPVAARRTKHKETASQSPPVSTAHLPSA